jgi:endonuclease/exonuclease/phosphatase family metal-dependent hydrolase
MSFNIRHGEGMDGRLDLARTASVIRSSQADLVAVQEVDRGTRRAGGADQLAELEVLTGLRGAFVRSIDYQGGAYGNAILSRFPIVAERNCPLPGKEPRSLLACDVELPSGRLLRFACTHLDLDEGQRLASVPLLDSFLERLPTMPTLLCGDLNSCPDSPVLAAFRRSGWQLAAGCGVSATYPADVPDICIDYVLHKHVPAGQAVSCVPNVLEPMASDHCPIAARFRCDPMG